MKTITIRIPYTSRMDVFRFVPFGDIHTGTQFCREKKAREKVREIYNDPFCFWIGMGDYGEFIGPRDKRFDAQQISPWVAKQDIAASQEDWLVDLLSPIRHKCLGLTKGNHEVSIQEQANHDIYGHLLKRLGANELGYSCFIQVIFERCGGTHTSIMFHVEHGSGGATTEGGKAMRLYKSMCGFEADVYLVGHLHDVKFNPISYVAMNTKPNAEPNEVKEIGKIGCLTGCYFASYADAPTPSYAEQKGYPPTNMGSPTIEITPDKREMSTSYKKVF